MSMQQTTAAAAVPFIDPDAIDGVSDGKGWLADLRQQGLSIYRTKGLPGTRVEAWRYTNLGKLTKADMQPVTQAPALSAQALAALPTIDLDGPTVVLVDGTFSSDLSRLDGLPDGVSIDGLAQLLAADPDALKGQLGSLVDGMDNLPLVALNTGLMTDGVVIRVADGVHLEAPIHVISVSYGETGPVVFHPRSFIAVGKGGAATVVESHVGTGEHATFSNGVTEVSLAAEASLKHYKLLNEQADGYNVAAALVDVAETATYEGFSLALAGRITRHESRVILSGEGAHAGVAGAYAVRDGQHVDNTVFVDHAVPRATSNQFFKGVLDETGKAVFQGKILVRRHAQETEGEQLHKALMLSRGAEVDTKPELEIYADDVKCSHGATCGEMDADQLFYLQARGIDAETARALLIEAFLEDVVGSITNETARDAFIARLRVWQKARNGAVWSDV